VDEELRTAESGMEVRAVMAGKGTSTITYAIHNTQEGRDEGKRRIKTEGNMP
jgi:hypothetical protein